MGHHGPVSSISIGGTSPSTADLADRYASVMPSFLHTLYDDAVSVERGEGGYVFDVEGNRYLDFFGGVLTTMIGHSHRRLWPWCRSRPARSCTLRRSS